MRAGEARKTQRCGLEHEQPAPYSRHCWKSSSSSCNQTALRAAKLLVPENSEIDAFQLDGFPMFDEDDEKRSPSSVMELKYLAGAFAWSQRTWCRARARCGNTSCCPRRPIRRAVEELTTVNLLRAASEARVVLDQILEPDLGGKLITEKYRPTPDNIIADTVGPVPD